MADNYQIDLTLEEIFGTGISSIEQTTVSTIPGGANVWTVTLTNGNSYDFTVLNGTAGGDPIPALTGSAMTDTSAVYLYLGSETGYTFGHWYYYDGTWKDGGAYGAKGDKGDDGFSPTASVSKSGTTTTITITDENGTTTAEVEDGVAPEATIAEKVSDWLDENITEPTGVVIDTSLQVAGAAADSKKVGDELSDLKSAIDQISVLEYSPNLLNPETATANSIFSTDESGNISTSAQWYSTYSVSDFIDVSEHTGETIYNTYGNAETANDRSWMFLRGYFFYDESKSKISGNSTASVNNVVVPDGAVYVRICTQSTFLQNKPMTYFGTGKVDYVAYYPPVTVPLDHDRVIALETAVSELSAPKVTLIPNTIYGVVGHPFSIYYYNIIKCDSLEGYHFFINPASSEVQNLGDRIRFKCTTAADYSITVSIRKNDTDDLFTFVLNVSIKAATIPSIKAMFIGDSFIDNGYIQSELMGKMGSALTLYGTRNFSNVPDYNNVNHSGQDEGRASWRLWNYCNSASFNGMTNPFYNNSTFDFAYYMQNNPSFNDVTDVFLLTGPNDSGWGDYSFRTSYQTVVNSIKAYNANIRIHAMMPITCFCEGYAWGIRNHNGGNEYRFNQFSFGKIIIDLYDSDANVFVIPTHMDFNKDYDFPTTEVASSDHNPTLMKVFNDNVHPSRYGYYGMADMIFGDIVANCQ